MISRTAKIATLAKKIGKFNLFPTPISYQFSHIYKKNIFLFSQNKEDKPNITPAPINPKRQNNAVDAQMKPVDERTEEEKMKDEPDQGMETTKFGNTMLIISAIALALAYAYMEIQVIRANKKKKPEARVNKQTTGVGKAHIGGDWELIATDGTKFSNKDLQGKYYLIYFGFTHCPDICPNSLTKLAKAVNKVRKSQDAKFFDLKTIFVSVDPDRDSGQKLKKFINLFDPQMVGVTGDHNQDPALRQCMKKFKIYASKLQFQEEDEMVKGRKSYTIDHTILTYLMSDTNEYLTHLGGNLGEHDLAAIIMEKIAEDRKQKMRGMNV